jgi:kumamolisin
MRKVMPRARRRGLQPALESLERREPLALASVPFATIEGAIAAGSRSAVAPIHVRSSLFQTRSDKPLILDFSTTASANGSSASAPRLNLIAADGPGHDRVTILGGDSSRGNLVASVQPGAYDLVVAGDGGSAYTVHVALAGDVVGDFHVGRADVAALNARIKAGVDVRANRHLRSLVIRNEGASTSVRPLTIDVSQEFQASDGGGNTTGLTNVVTVQSAAKAGIVATAGSGGSSSSVANSDGAFVFDAGALGIQSPALAQFTATDAFGQRVQAASMVGTPSLVPIGDSALPSANDLTAPAPLPGSATISALIVLNPIGDLTALQNMDDADLADRTYLTQQQMGAEYGASAQDLAAVQQFAQSAGLTVTYALQETGTVRVTGSASAFALAFGVTPMGAENALNLPWTYDGSLYVPSTLQAAIAGIVPVSNTPNGSFDPNPSGVLAGSQAVAPNVTPQISPVTPLTLASDYTFPTVAQPGAGENVGILEMVGVYDQQAQSDFATYMTGLVEPIPQVTAYGPQTPTSAPEMQLDMDTIGAVAPSANLSLYFGRGGLGDMLETIQSAAFSKVPINVLSISYGYAETYVSPLFADLFNRVFMEAAGMGITTYVAAGDSGSSGGQGNGLASLDFPASDPYVTSAGGTQYSGPLNSTEVAWNQVQKYGDVYAPTPKLGATGGGVSTLFTAVPSYQAQLRPQPTSANPGGGTGRAGPDVASLAGAPYIQIRAFGVDTAVGGTSAAAPLWAGLTAILDQQLEAQPDGLPLGFFNSILYLQLEADGITNATTDITSGTNATGYFPSPDNTVYVPTGIGYTAGPGWDMTTGWGTPNGQDLLDDLENLLNKPT